MNGSAPALHGVGDELERADHRDGARSARSCGRAAAFELETWCASEASPDGEKAWTNAAPVAAVTCQISEPAPPGRTRGRRGVREPVGAPKPMPR